MRRRPARRPRPVLVSPDKFKGTLSAERAAAAVSAGLARCEIPAVSCRIADGGEGTIDALLAADEQLTTQQVTSVDALGDSTEARLLDLGGGTLLIESAESIGLALVPPAHRDAEAASSAGVGEMIVLAAGSGAREVVVGIGGTASSDGGHGALEVLREHKLVGRRGALKRCPKLTLLCDVRTAFEQAAEIYAPQKGADAAAVERLTARLHSTAEELPRDPRGLLMSGAGGGLAGGLWAAAGAELKSGAAWLLERIGFNEQLLAARAVITGEGSLDQQTLLGKAVGEVATRARQAGVPCHAIVGRSRMSEFEARIIDLESVQEATDEAAISAAAAALKDLLPAY